MKEFNEAKRALTTEETVAMMAELAPAVYAQNLADVELLREETEKAALKHALNAEYGNPERKEPVDEKSSMELWAEREIEFAIACEKAAAEHPEDWEYGGACYMSAYRAFESLCKDGHSGCSIGFTQNILNRLIDGKPLTPIEDVPEVWNYITDNHGAYITYQCKRMSALFKDVYPDGTVKYHSVDGHVCIDINGGSTYTSGFIGKIVEEMYPITMPYIPGERIKVYCEDCLTDRKNGDYDTKAIRYLIKDGERVEINRFWKEGEHDWIEIDEAEYDARKMMHANRVAAESLIADYDGDPDNLPGNVLNGVTQNTLRIMKGLEPVDIKKGE